MEKIKVLFLSEWWENPYKKMLIDSLNSNGIQVEKCSWKSIIFLPQVLEKGKPDILHLHTLHRFLLGRNEIVRWIKLFIFIIQVFILRIIGTKVIWTVHEWSDKFSDGKQPISATQAAILGKFIHGIITHCNTTKQEIKKIFRLENEDKVFVIHHGNYINYYENTTERLEARKALGIQNENLVFLLLGNIFRYKGILEAIDAFKHLQQDNTSLIIAGNPSDRELEELIIDKIKECENILFVPKRIPDDELQIYMNTCDCVVIPYKVFTTSGIAILAMSFGRACLAPNSGFFSDVLDESGAILYDSNHEDGLVYAMKQALENKNNFLFMGKHNLKLAEQWNWSYVGEETFKLYQRCLDS